MKVRARDTWRTYIKYCGFVSKASTLKRLTAFAACLRIVDMVMESKKLLVTQQQCNVGSMSQTHIPRKSQRPLLGLSPEQPSPCFPVSLLFAVFLVFLLHQSGCILTPVKTELLPRAKDLGQSPSVYSMLAFLIFLFTPVQKRKHTRVWPTLVD